MIKYFSPQCAGEKYNTHTGIASLGPKGSEDSLYGGKTGGT